MEVIADGEQLEMTKSGSGDVLVPMTDAGVCR
jgi:hypothetical protein